MKFVLLIFTLSYSALSMAFSGDGMPFKYISSCEIDLNGDQKADKAFLIEGLKGRELIALIATTKGYEAHVVSTEKPNMYLSCHTGSEVKETMAAGRNGKVVKTPGGYLQLTKPESSSVAFVWNKKTFQEVWTAD